MILRFVVLVVIVIALIVFVGQIAASNVQYGLGRILVTVGLYTYQPDTGDPESMPGLSAGLSAMMDQFPAVSQFSTEVSEKIPPILMTGFIVVLCLGISFLPRWGKYAGLLVVVTVSLIGLRETLRLLQFGTALGGNSLQLPLDAMIKLVAAALLPLISWWAGYTANVIFKDEDDQNSEDAEALEPFIS